MVVALVTVLVMCVASAGAVPLTPSAASQIATPADAAADPGAGFEAVSCASIGTCAAIGQYTGSSSYEQMAVAETNGTWTRAVDPAPPANGEAGSVVLNDVSCAPGGVCTAVGYYQTQMSQGEAMVVSEKNGVWGTAAEVTLPGDANSDPVAVLSAISCGAAGSCAAVGSYGGGYGTAIGPPTPLAVSESGGTWHAGVAVVVPASDYEYGALTAVSCASDGSCGAIGYYDASGSGNTTDTSQFATSGSGGAWSDGTTLAGPPGPGSNGMTLASLSCPAAGYCSAVGLAVTSSPGAIPVTSIETVDSEVGGIWGTAAAVAPPSGITIPQAGLGQVSCWSAGNCAAVGGGNTSGGDMETESTFVDETNGTWENAAAYSSSVGLGNSLSCDPAGTCVAVGLDTQPTSSSGSGGVFEETDGTWSGPVSVESPPNAAPNSGVLQWVSCAADGSCGAVGYYEDPAGGTLAMATSIGEPANSSATTPTCAASGSADACTATVTGDTTAGAPTGAVTFSATAGTFPKGAACSLAATGPSTASCTVSFTPPAAGTQGTLTLTAAYGGDDSYSISTGTLTLCADGSDFALYSVNPVGRHDFGIEIGGNAVLTGCGLAAGQIVQWGNALATETLSASDITDGGASATVVVPWAATSGDVSVADGATTSTVGDNAIDSWRNTLGFNFQNYEELNDIPDFVDAFTGSNLESKYTLYNGKEVFLEPEARALYDLHTYVDGNPVNKVRMLGRCFGIAVLTAQFADGSIAFDRYGKAPTPYGLSLAKNPELRSAIQTDWWKQFSIQEIDAEDQSTTGNDPTTTADGLRVQLITDFGPNGFTHPVIFNIGFWAPETEIYEVGGQKKTRVVYVHQAHTVTAFGVSSPDAQGDYTIYAYNSNTPFISPEDADGPGHVDQQLNSDILVDADGTWSAPREKATGSLSEGSVTAVPIKALEEPLLATGTQDLVVMDDAAGTIVSQASSPTTGQPVNLAAAASGGLHIAADSNSDSSATSPTADGSMISGPAGIWRDTVTDPDGQVATLWRTDKFWASLNGSAGTDTTDFVPGTGALSVGQAAQTPASSNATVALYANGDDDRTENVVTVTGPLAPFSAVREGMVCLCRPGWLDLE